MFVCYATFIFQMNRAPRKSKRQRTKDGIPHPYNPVGAANPMGKRVVSYSQLVTSRFGDIFRTYRIRGDFQTISLKHNGWGLTFTCAFRDGRYHVCAHSGSFRTGRQGLSMDKLDHIASLLKNCSMEIPDEAGEVYVAVEIVQRDRATNQPSRFSNHVNVMNILSSRSRQRCTDELMAVLLYFSDGERVAYGPEKQAAIMASVAQSLTSSGNVCVNTLLLRTRSSLKYDALAEMIRDAHLNNLEGLVVHNEIRKGVFTTVQQFGKAKPFVMKLAGEVRQCALFEQTYGFIVGLDEHDNIVSVAVYVPDGPDRLQCVMFVPIVRGAAAYSQPLIDTDYTLEVEDGDTDTDSESDSDCEIVDVHAASTEHNRRKRDKTRGAVETFIQSMDYSKSPVTKSVLGMVKALQGILDTIGNIYKLRQGAAVGPQHSAFRLPVCGVRGTPGIVLPLGKYVVVPSTTCSHLISNVLAVSFNQVIRVNEHDLPEHILLDNAILVGALALSGSDLTDGSVQSKMPTMEQKSHFASLLGKSKYNAYEFITLMSCVVIDGHSAQVFTEPPACVTMEDLRACAAGGSPIDKKRCLVTNVLYAASRYIRVPFFMLRDPNKAYAERARKYPPGTKGPLEVMPPWRGVRMEYISKAPYRTYKLWVYSVHFRGDNPNDMTLDIDRRWLPNSRDINYYGFGVLGRSELTHTPSAQTVQEVIVSMYAAWVLEVVQTRLNDTSNHELIHDEHEKVTIGVRNGMRVVVDSQKKIIRNPLTITHLERQLPDSAPQYAPLPMEV